MSGAKVIETLGSPNIVSTDETRREVWVYDKISTERIYSTSSGGVNVLVIGGALIGSGWANFIALPRRTPPPKRWLNGGWIGRCLDSRATRAGYGSEYNYSTFIA